MIGLTLTGLGRGWLSRSQRALARIHRDEGSSSSGLSSGRPGTGGSAAYTSSDEARDAARAAAEADARIHTPDYVEARGILLPSTDHFNRAVTAAERRGLLTGELLALVSFTITGRRKGHKTYDHQAAEAYMSLGNVSYSYDNERYFRQALVYLRRASQLPNYNLSPYLQKYVLVPTNPFRTALRPYKTMLTRWQLPQRLWQTHRLTCIKPHGDERSVRPRRTAAFWLNSAKDRQKFYDLRAQIPFLSFRQVMQGRSVFGLCRTRVSNRKRNRRPFRSLRKASFHCFGTQQSRRQIEKSQG